MSHPASLSPEHLLRECQVTRTRRSGPGGQNRNKVETAVVLKHSPTGIVAEANERRHQGENLTAAVFRLRLKLALEIREKRGASSEPSALWRSRCREGRIAINPSHDDFPSMLAEALDYLYAMKMDVGAAADRLGCSPSQLMKLIQKEPAAFSRVNDRRRDLGMHSLRR